MATPRRNGQKKNKGEKTTGIKLKKEKKAEDQKRCTQRK